MQQDTDNTIAGDVLTQARLDRGDVIIISSERGGLEFKTPQVPIDQYLNRRIITMADWRAANKLFQDFSLSGQVPGMTANLDPMRGGRGEFSQAQLEARERWRTALSTVQSLIGRLMLLNVCCYGYYLNQINYLPHKVGVNNRTAKFREALDDLRMFYDEQRKIMIANRESML